MKTPYRLLRSAAALALAAAFSSLARATLYVTPASSFVTSPTGGETIVSLQDTSGSIATAQSTLTAARTAHPTAILVLYLNASSYSVSTAGLLLGSNESVVLSPTTTVQAASGATAAYLVGVSTGSSNVSISGGTLNGNGASLNCVQVNASNRVNVSDLTAQDAALNLIQVYGNSQTTFDNELTVANCTCSQGTGTQSGISVHNATQAVVIDNTCTGCAGGSGIYLKSCANCTVAENTCTGNGTGITIFGNNNSVTDNTCSTNGTGIALTGTTTGSSANLCTSNTLDTNTTVAIAASGTSDTIFDNTLSGNTATLTLSGSGNNVIPRLGALTAGQNYFYPPLTDDQQAGTVVSGKSRADVTVSGTTLSSIQSSYNSAKTSNPGKVIVLHLTASSITGDSTLTLTSDTCVLLGGTIHLNSGVTGMSASSQSFISVSGGTIDGGNSTSAVALSFSGCSMIQVDGMTVQNFGPTTPRSGSAAIHFSGSGTPILVTRCVLNQGSARGLWLENPGYQAVVSRSSFNNFNMDGIDCDAHTATSLVKYNTCDDDYRAGIFVEQGDTYDQLVGNTLDGNHRAGVSVWNNGVSGNESPTEFNTLVGNVCDGNIVGTPSSGSGSSTGYGMETGSQNPDSFQEFVSHNFFFNNEAQANEGTGQQDADLGAGSGGSTGSVQNYYSQNLVSGNGTTSGSDFALSSNGGDLFYNSPVPYRFDPVQMSPVGSGAPVGSMADSHTPFGELEYLSATGTGQTMTLTTPPTLAGTYTVQLGYKAYTARGQCTVTVDGHAVGGTVDQYSATSQYLTATLGSVTLASGPHTIVMTVTGKNASSTAYTITADDYTLIGQ